MKNIKTFTVNEVKQLVMNAYEVGFCDGIDNESLNEDFKEYKNAEDFWERNFEKWITKEITYVTK